MYQARFTCPYCNRGRIAKVKASVHNAAEKLIYRRYACGCGRNFTTIEREEEVLRGMKTREDTLRVLLHKAIDTVFYWSGNPWNPKHFIKLSKSKRKRRPLSIEHKGNSDDLHF